MDMEIRDIAIAKKDLSNGERIQFDTQIASRRKNPTTALLLSLFLGNLGVDRFYIGQTGLGFAKLFTLGGLFVWGLIDLFIIMKAARRMNSRLANQIRDSLILARPTSAAAGGPIEEKRSIAHDPHENKPPKDAKGDSLKAE